MPKKKLGEILLQRGVLTARQLEHALRLQREDKALLGEVLLRLGAVDQADLDRALAEQHGVPYVVLEDEQIDPQVVMLVPESFARCSLAVPFCVSGDTIHVAMMAPDDLWAISEIELLTGYQVRPFVAMPSALLRVIEHCFDRSLATRQTIVDMRFEELRKGTRVKKLDVIAADALDAADVPVVRLVNSIVSGGLTSGASDIHFEPQHPEMRIRYRIDGVLYDNMTIPRHIEPALVSRVKVMADLDITERRHPQDGHITFNMEGRAYDLRVSTMPTVGGEKVVIRIFETDAQRFALERIGFSPQQQETVERFLSHPYGMILVTGPTGSGKSTTLYAMLNHLNRPDINIVTLEDPVENQIAGLNQIGVDANFGMSFASGLKYILRQDPDIVMVGEIRDGETAEIAVQAALTGHLLLSTLHTNDAVGAATRLTDLGVAPFLVSSALVGVVAQRLMRRVCPNCREPWEPPEGLIEEFGKYADVLRHGAFVRGKGCDQCFGMGYRGRCAIFEILVASPEILDLIERRASAAELKQQAVLQGMRTLTDVGVQAALDGQTSLEEIRQRVLVWEQHEEPKPEPV